MKIHCGVGNVDVYGAIAFKTLTAVNMLVFVGIRLLLLLESVSTENSQFLARYYEYCSNNVYHRLSGGFSHLPINDAFFFAFVWLFLFSILGNFLCRGSSLSVCQC